MKLAAVIAVVLGVVASAQGSAVDDMVAANPSLASDFGNVKVLTEALQKMRDGATDDFTDVQKAFLQSIIEMDEEMHSNKTGRLLRSEERELLSSSENALYQDGWNMIKASYPSDSVVVDNTFFAGNDRIKVVPSGGKCWVVAQESNDLEDWAMNLDVGYDNIGTIYWNEPESYCCKRSWGWCTRTCTRTVTRSHTFKGHDGFVKPLFRTSKNGGGKTAINHVNSLIDAKCGGIKTMVYAGYSRGGAIVQSIAAHHLANNKYQGGYTRHLVTFGSPRCLDPESANRVQNSLGMAVRVVKEKRDWMGTKHDLVPSVPAGWWGFQHVGKTIHPGNSIDHNGPTFGSLWTDIGLHLQYP